LEENRIIQTEENIKESRKDRTLRIISAVLMILEGVLSLGLTAVLFDFNVFPLRYLLIFAAGLAVIFAAVFLLRYKGFVRRIISSAIALIMCIVMAVGGYYIYLTNRTIQSITGEGYSIRVYKVAVKADDQAETLSDISGYTFGTVRNFEFPELDQAISEISEESGTDIQTKDYPSADKLLDAWYDGEVEGMIYEGYFNGLFDDLSETYYRDFKLIREVPVKSEMSDQMFPFTPPVSDETEPQEESTEPSSETLSAETTASDQTEETTADETETIDPFIVLISGNDEYNEVSLTGRSDVNMLVVVNFEKRQALLVSIPRDYYVRFPGVTGDSKDKLTHSSIYGIDIQKDSINELFGIDIDYYVRVNFTSVVDIIDAIGGLAFYNPYPFGTTYYNYYFDEGEVWVDGWQALQYARERQSLEGGDFARGQHQQIVIEAMIDKLVSAASIANYSALMDAVDSCAITDMPEEMIKKIVRLQLDQGGSWNVLKVQALGDDDFRPSFAAGGMELSVIIPYRESVEYVADKINRVYNGEVIENIEEDLPESYSYLE